MGLEREYSVAFFVDAPDEEPADWFEQQARRAGVTDLGWRDSYNPGADRRLVGTWSKMFVNVEDLHLESQRVVFLTFQCFAVRRATNAPADVPAPGDGALDAFRLACMALEPNAAVLVTVGMEDPLDVIEEIEKDMAELNAELMPLRGWGPVYLGIRWFVWLAFPTPVKGSELAMPAGRLLLGYPFSWL